MNWNPSIKQPETIADMATARLPSHKIAKMLGIELETSGAFAWRVPLSHHASHLNPILGRRKNGQRPRSWPIDCLRLRAINIAAIADPFSPVQPKTNKTKPSRVMSKERRI